jgi:hypothetical protein
MTRTELIIQLLQVAIGLAFGAYLVWWSLQVLDRLTPEYDARTGIMKDRRRVSQGVRGVDPRLRATRRLHANAWLRADTRGGGGGVREELAKEVAMAKTTTPLTAEERVILFCTATGVSHAAVGITAHAMQSIAIKGFIVHDRESGAYALTDSGRAALLAILGDAGLT